MAADNKTAPMGRASTSVTLFEERGTARLPRAIDAPLDKVRVFQRKLYRAAKANPKRKFGVLYDKLCREDVLQRAYVDVRLNKGAPGVDEMTFDHIENEIGTDVFLAGIRDQLIT